MTHEEFRQLVLDQMQSLYRMAWQLTRHEDEAADIVQETLLKAIKAEHRFELRDVGIRPWLFKILHNVFYTKVSKRKREPTLVEDLKHENMLSELDEPAPCWDLESLDWEQVDERIKHALDELDIRYREVLLLWAIEGLKYREVAEVLDVPLGTVMSRLYRARGILSEKLAEVAQEQGIAIEEV